MSLDIARMIDHALLAPTMTDDQIREGCELARQLNVATVCVKPYAVPLAAEVLAGSEVGVGTVIGFPHGSNLPEVKALEADLACRQGAVELDMVMNVGKALQGDWDYVLNDIAAVVAVGQKRGAVTKVILETDLLTSDDIISKLCEICTAAGADYVKTSTGFGFTKQASGDYNYVGATEHHVALMKQSVGPGVQVKASGGVRTYEDAVKMVACGATRLGTSSSAAIVQGAGDQSGY